MCRAGSTAQFAGSLGQLSSAGGVPQSRERQGDLRSPPAWKQAAVGVLGTSAMVHSRGTPPSTTNFCAPFRQRPARAAARSGGAGQRRAGRGRAAGGGGDGRHRRPRVRPVPAPLHLPILPRADPAPVQLLRFWPGAGAALPGAAVSLPAPNPAPVLASPRACAACAAAPPPARLPGEPVCARLGASALAAPALSSGQGIVHGRSMATAGPAHSCPAAPPRGAGAGAELRAQPGGLSELGRGPPGAL